MSTLDELVRSLLLLEVIRQRLVGLEQTEAIDEGMQVVRAMAEQALEQVAALERSPRNDEALAEIQRRDLLGHLMALQSVAAAGAALDVDLDATFAAGTRLGRIARLSPGMTSAEAAELRDVLKDLPV